MRNYDEIKHSQSLVSVIMPCYNDGEYIQKSVESVLLQTYPNIELIIIDDGSDSPETIEVINELEKNERIILLRGQRLYPAGARNLGIRNASGKFILPVDSDDLIEPTYIEKAVQVIESSEDIGVVYCKADLFGEQTGPWQLPDYSFEHMLLDNIVFVTALFYKADWEKVGGFSTEMRQGMEDYDFWLSILEIGKEIYQIPETLFHYRIKTVSRTTNFQQSEESVKEIYRKIYLRHSELYMKYHVQYAMILRDALIDQLFINRALKKSVDIYERIRKVPLLKYMIKKMLGRK